MHRTQATLSLSLLAFGLVLAVAPAHALKLTTWNILDYPYAVLAARQPNFRTVMSHLDTDVLVVQELKSQAGRDSFLNNVLNVVQPGQWDAKNTIVSAEGTVFYKPAKVSIPTYLSANFGGPRDVLIFRVRPVEFTTNAGAIRVYSVHLKAGNTTGDEDEREVECTNLRNSLNNVTDPFLVTGDFNTYGSTDRGLTKLVQSQADNDGQCQDALHQPGPWHTNSAYAYIHTQSPCLSCLSGNFTGGGMDDRFDLWLGSNQMFDGEGFDCTDSYVTYGNDGQHFNTDINAFGFNNAVGITVANALHDAADHLPVVLTIQIPAKLYTQSQLDFGNYITGGTTYNGIMISNVSSQPADELTFSFSAPPGFGAPAGTFTQGAGVPASGYEITMDTSTPGVKTGTLLVNSDYPDTTSKQVLLSGRVLRHAAPSLDSLTTLTGEILSFGAGVPGSFTDHDVRVHNRGYDPLQAQLSLDQAQITGSTRFSIVGGFTPGLVAGTARTLSIHFDDTGAPLDSTYGARLTLKSADEPLPGGSSQPDLTVELTARVASSPAGVTPDLPTALRFYPPRPNPTSNGVRFAFDLPRPAPVSLDLLDLSGRRVGKLASGEWSAGHHVVNWTGVDALGRRVSAGLYFARFTTPGLHRIERVVVLP